MEPQFDRDFLEKIEVLKMLLKNTNQENLSEEKRQFINKFTEFLEKGECDLKCKKHADKHEQNHWKKFDKGFWHGNHHGKHGHGHHGRHGHGKHHHGMHGHHGKFSHHFGMHGHHSMFGHGFGKHCHKFGKHGKHGHKGGKHFWALWEKNLMDSNMNEDTRRFFENISAETNVEQSDNRTTQPEGISNAFKICFRKGFWKRHGYKSWGLVDGYTQTEDKSAEIVVNNQNTQENMDTSDPDRVSQSPTIVVE